jgi:hypothetical protein
VQEKYFAVFSKNFAHENCIALLDFFLKKCVTVSL